MRYIKLFENFNESYNDILVDFIENDRFKINIVNRNMISIDISYIRPTSEIINRNIVGYFDTRNIRLHNNTTGPIYDRLKKSSDTLDIIDRIEDVVLKFTNFTDNKVGYFILVGDKIRIYLGQRLLDIHNS